MTTRLKVDFAGPFVSVQDQGRPGYLRFGVTESGPMDRAAYDILSAALDRGDDWSAIEVSAGGIQVTCLEGSITAGVVGGEFDVRLNKAEMPPWSVFKLEPGAVLSIRPGASGSWAYLGFAGDIDKESWLDSRATLLTSGLCGAPYKSGDLISIDNAQVRPDLSASLPIPDFSRFDGRVRVVPGPQDDLFEQSARDALATETFAVTPEYDRMGMRLSGAKLEMTAALSIPSEALIRGAVQVPGHGDPIVLLADHQTTGGYPKIATVIAADQDKLAQARPGDRLRFTLCDVEHATQATRAAHTAIQAYIDALPDLRGSLSERLNRLNLISGIVGPDE